MADPDRASLVEDTERWFLRRGIPHFIEDYRAGEDVLTRALPVLALVFVVEVAGAGSVAWTWWQNLLAILAGGLLVATIWAGVNRLRGRRPFHPPDDVGWWELSVFLLVPPLLPLVFGGQLGAAAATVAANVAILIVVYLVTSYGLVPMTRWALVQTAQQVGAVLGLFGRAMPLLLLFSVALFVNAEVWAVAAALDGLMLGLTCALFVALGLGFLLLRLPGEVRAIDAELTPDAAARACEGSPLGEVAGEVLTADPPPARRPLSRRQEGNVLLVLLFSQAVQVALVTVALVAFFFAFGLVAIRPEVVVAWVGATGEADLLASWVWAGRSIEVSWALVKVTTLLGALGGFYFTVYVITDATYREEFFTEIIDRIRESLAVRTAYLALRATTVDRRAPPHLRR